MTNSDSPGELFIDENTKQISIDWDPNTHKKYNHTVEKALRQAVEILGGHCAVDPLWSSQFGPGHLSRHPIGGCCMGNTGLNGVVNDKGQVFIGKFDCSFYYSPGSSAWVDFMYRYFIAHSKYYEKTYYGKLVDR